MGKVAEKVEAAKARYRKVPAYFWPEISPKGVRQVAALIADEGVAAEDACLLVGYAPDSLDRLLSSGSENAERCGRMVEWAQAEFRRRMLGLLREASEKGSGAGAAQAMLQAVDTRFAPKSVHETGAQGITINFLMAGGAREMRELETKVIAVGVPNQLGDGG